MNGEKRILQLLLDAVAGGVFPGAVLLVARHKKTLFCEAVGNGAGLPAPRLMTSQTRFDLASLTKPLATALTVLCLVSQEKLQLDDSLAAFRKVIGLDNTDPEGWFGAGLIYHRQTSYQEAITYILKAIEFDGNNLDYWLNLGYANEDAGFIKEAVKCYGYVTRMDGADLDLQNPQHLGGRRPLHEEPDRQHPDRGGLRRPGRDHRCDPVAEPSARSVANRRWIHRGVRRGHHRLLGGPEYRDLVRRPFRWFQAAAHDAGAGVLRSGGVGVASREGYQRP